MRRTFRILFYSFLTLVMLAACAFVFLPWKEVGAPMIAGQLRARGIPLESFRIGRLNMHGVTLEALTFATQPPVTLPEITLGWDIANLTSPRLNELTLRGMRYTIKPSGGNKQDTAPLPADPAFFAQIPLERILIEDAKISMTEKSAGFTLPFSGVLELHPTPKLTLRSDGAELVSGDTKLEAKAIALDLTLNAEKKRWEGALNIASVTDVSETPTLPALTPAIKLMIGARSVTAKMTSGDYRGDVTYSLNDGNAKLANLSLPFAGGKVEAAPFTYQPDKPMAASFALTGIDLQTALKLLMEESGLSAEGTLDGTIPVTLTDGMFSLGAGELKAREGGKLALSGDSLGALGGAGGQAGNVALLLGDFRFQLLKIDFEPAPNNEVVARLRLEGNNPNVYDGKRVNLNVTLKGDVMKSLRSSMELLNAPQEWIKKEMQ